MSNRQQQSWGQSRASLLWKELKPELPEDVVECKAYLKGFLSELADLLDDELVWMEEPLNWRAFIKGAVDKPID